MNREEMAIIKIIGEYLLSNKFDILENFLSKIKAEGKFKKVKKNLEFIIDYLYQKKNISRGDLELAFETNENFIKEKIKTRGFLVREIKINASLILGGVFRSKQKELNFSLINILKKIFL